MVEIECPGTYGPPEVGTLEDWTCADCGCRVIGYDICHCGSSKSVEPSKHVSWDWDEAVKATQEIFLRKAEDSARAMGRFP